MIVPLYPTDYYMRNSLTGLINAALAAPLLLSAAKVMLGTANISPGLTTAFADLVEASYTGYAESATVVWAAPINDVDTTPTSIGALHVFLATGSGSTPGITCIGVTDGVASPSTGILASGNLLTPIDMSVSGNGFAVVVNWNMGNVPGNLVATVIQ